MTTPITDRHESGVLSEDTEPSRWGIRLRELATEIAPPALEPLESRAKPTFWQRVRRGTALPIAAAAAVFIAVLLFSIVTVWLQPHSIGQAPTAQGGSSLTAEPTSVSNGSQTAAPLGGEAAGAHTDAASALAAAGALYVHVVGEVNRPGCTNFSLAPGRSQRSKPPHGATEGAVLAGLNLARTLVDGEQLVVPDAELAGAALASGLSVPVTGAGSPIGGLVSLNTSDQSALETLPPCRPLTRAKIIDWRTTNGGFQSVEQLLNVSGIGQKTYEQLSELVTL